MPAPAAPIPRPRFQLRPEVQRSAVFAPFDDGRCGIGKSVFDGHWGLSGGPIVAGPPAGDLVGIGWVGGPGLPRLDASRHGGERVAQDPNGWRYGLPCQLAPQRQRNQQSGFGKPEALPATVRPPQTAAERMQSGRRRDRRPTNGADRMYQPFPSPMPLLTIRKHRTRCAP